MLGSTKKIINRLLINPRRKGLSKDSIILDRKFGAGRGTPIDRNLIQDFVSSSIPAYNEKMHVLEFGDSIISSKLLKNHLIYTFLFEKDQKIFVDNNEKLVTGDLLKDSGEIHNGFDLIVATQLLAFTKNPFKSARSLVSMLNPGGIIIGTEPFCSPISSYDDERWGDYFRFTTKGLQAIYGDISGISVTTTPLGNWETTFSVFKGFCTEDNLLLSEKKDVFAATNIGYLVRNS